MSGQPPEDRLGNHGNDNSADKNIAGDSSSFPSFPQVCIVAVLFDIFSLNARKVYNVCVFQGEIFNTQWNNVFKM